jgi:hypothetical protein
VEPCVSSAAGEFVVNGASIVAPRELQRSPIYSDILARMPARDVLSALLSRGSGVEVP